MRRKKKESEEEQRIWRISFAKRPGGEWLVRLAVLPREGLEGSVPENRERKSGRGVGGWISGGMGFESRDKCVTVFFGKEIRESEKVNFCA